MMGGDAQALYYALVCITKIFPNLLYGFCNLNYINHVYHDYVLFYGIIKYGKYVKHIHVALYHVIHV